MAWFQIFLYDQGTDMILVVAKTSQKNAYVLHKMDIFSIYDSVTENRPVLAKIRSALVRLSADKWQLTRCPPISSLQSLKSNSVSRPRLDPQSPLTIERKEHSFDDIFIT